MKGKGEVKMKALTRYREHLAFIHVGISKIHTMEFSILQKVPWIPEISVENIRRAFYWKPILIGCSHF